MTMDARSLIRGSARIPFTSKISSATHGRGSRGVIQGGNHVESMFGYEWFESCKSKHLPLIVKGPDIKDTGEELSMVKYRMRLHIYLRKWMEGLGKILHALFVQYIQYLANTNSVDINRDTAQKHGVGDANRTQRKAHI